VYTAFRLVRRSMATSSAFIKIGKLPETLDMTSAHSILSRGDRLTGLNHKCF
jgi:hypothetical protein